LALQSNDKIEKLETKLKGLIADSRYTREGAKEHFQKNDNLSDNKVNNFNENLKEDIPQNNKGFFRKLFKK